MDATTLKFLIVDDFASMRHIVRNQLKELGYSHIEEAEDGNAALARLKAGRIDVVITDWIMPNLSGLDLLRAIRANPDTQQIPVLMVTAKAVREDILAAAQAGASGYILKPFSANVLHTALAKIFVRHGLKTGANYA